MNTLRTILTRLLNLLAGASFLVMVVLTCWQVFTRYILGSPSSWSEELVSYMFAWMSLLGASIVTSERGHMNIPILVDLAGPGGKKALLCLGEVIAFLFSLVILVLGGRADCKAGHGADDLLPGGAHRRLLCGPAFVRHPQYAVYPAEHPGDLLQ